MVKNEPKYDILYVFLIYLLMEKQFFELNANVNIQTLPWCECLHADYYYYYYFFYNILVLHTSFVLHANRS